MSDAKLPRRSTCGALEEVAECKLVAEAEGGGNLLDGFFGGDQHCSGGLRSLTLQITGKRFSHRRVEQVGTIFFRVSQESGQELEGESLVKVPVYKFRDVF